ncbi:ATP-binding protein [Streptomonospora litoralis]|uniref:Regulatory protein AfsR n=1 Tax=Streptomonospora litoralis TaxID=2498135 RepID=A0A4V0ZJD3_9ACTN|nr:tetratricopeptide repeat protein [Streptomonospora litoralis]QBI53082.1 Regulatory protein AfsR [Streptomonospora litoralis]
MTGPSRDVVQAGRVSGGVHIHHGAAGAEGTGARTPPRQLPGEPHRFVHRTAELDRLDGLRTAEGDYRPGVCVIAGTAGAGKTALALRWAHRSRERFPDGQLYVNLRGYDPGEPLPPLEALHRFLGALGVPAPAIPAEAESAAALYRSVLAERAMLILLDNAGTDAQVRPLLPGLTRSLVLVTSRDRLSGLAVRDGAHRITLGTLAEAEAVELLRTVTADYRPDDTPEQLAELSRLCARLPLALRIAAERAASRPHLRLDDLIADLRDESALWEALSTGDDEEADAVHSVFAWSYRALPPQAARLFRLLGLHPGPDFGPGAASALAQLSLRRARHQLDVLVGAHVLEQTAPDRYTFHDLLRAYSADQAGHDEPAEQRTAALRRVLDWYLHTADAAQAWIEPNEDRLHLDPPAEGVAPLTFAEYDHAVDWAEREHANFLPAVRAAEQAGLDRHAWQLAAVLYNAQSPSAVAADWLSVGGIGLEAARRLGDRRAQARLLESVGFCNRRVDRLAEAFDAHTASLEIWEELGDRRGRADAHNALGLIAMRKRDLDSAAAHLTRAVAGFDELGLGHWSAVCRSNLAEVHYQAGRLDDAAAAVEAALADHRRRGDDRSIGNALRIASDIHLDRGQPEAALRAADEALEIATDLRDHVMEGYWLLSSGRAQQALGRAAEAQPSYHRSAVLHRRLGDRSREARAWQGTAQVYLASDRTADAVGFLRRAAEAHRTLNDPWHEAAALEALAQAVEPEAPEEADRHRGEALRLLGPFEDPRAAGIRERIELLRRSDGDG